MKKCNDYWNDRGDNGVLYGDERFYTITSLPLYIDRREHMKKFILDNVKCDDSSIKILDFGCGDGYYSIFTKSNYPNAEIYGIDISSTMIQSAKKNADNKNMDIDFSLSQEFDNNNINVIIVFLVLAHILDKSELNGVLDKLKHSLCDSGKILVVESTGYRNQKFQFAERRTQKEYEALFNEVGFSIEKSAFWSCPLFILFENIYRVIFTAILKIKSIKCKNIDIRNLNKYKSYLKVSFFLFKLFKNIDKRLQFIRWKGNTFFILSKK